MDGGDERNRELESNSQIYGLINWAVDREHRKKSDVRRKRMSSSSNALLEESIR